MGLFSRMAGVRTRIRRTPPRLPLSPRSTVLAATLALGVFLGATTAFADPLGSAYAVQPGDTVDAIATRSGVSVYDLVVSNPGLNLYQLVVGETLLVPPAPSAAPTGWMLPPSSALANSAHVPAFAITPDGVVVRSLAPAPATLAITPAPATLATTPAPFAATSAQTATTYLRTVYHSQFDGSIWAESNCGPTTLSMALGALGISADQISLRMLANAQMRDNSPNNGTSWDALAYAAEQSGATPIGVMDAANGRKPRFWSVNDVTAELNAGHPVMLLVRYWDLPDHLGSTYGGDHYIVALGVDSSGNIVYDDSAAKNGAYLTMTPEQLLSAWRDTNEGINQSAMALSRG